MFDPKLDDNILRSKIFVVFRFISFKSKDFVVDVGETEDDLRG